MKPLSYCLHTAGYRVAPLWERGLKPFHRHRTGHNPSVAPLWERGLKPLEDNEQIQQWCRSLMGAWIETANLSESSSVIAVAPLWERGLNHSVDKADGKVIVSLSAKSEL